VFAAGPLLSMCALVPNKYVTTASKPRGRLSVQASYSGMRLRFGQRFEVSTAAGLLMSL
jgi:hypothetical protein